MAESKQIPKVTEKNKEMIQISNNPATDKKDELVNLLKECRGQKHLIVIQNYPDPDAISTALAYQIIAKTFGVESDIVYAGIISHPENIAMVKLLNIEMIKWDKTFDLSPYHGSVFVDNQGTTAETIVGALKEKQIQELIVIDHHELQDRLKPKFTDIRKVGATATIFTEYLQDEIIHLERSHKLHITLATAMMHGIRSDTTDFILAQSEDFKAAAFLSNFIDSEILSQIASQSRSKQTMNVIETALDGRSVRESYSISGIGYVRSEERDAIPQAADFLLTEENVHTAIVFGVIISSEKKESIVGSMRTSRITIDPDEFLKDVFGKDTNGRYFGGGKESAGGFEIPIGFLTGGADKEFKEMKWKLYKSQIMQKILTKIGATEEITKEEKES